MPKYRPAGRRARSTAPSRAAGIPCIILLVSAFVLVMLFIYFVMKYSAQ